MIEGLDGLFYSARHELHCMIEKPFTVKYLLSYFHKQAWLDLSQLRKMPTGEESVKHLLVKHRLLNTDKQEALDRVVRQLEVQRYSDQTVASYRSALRLFLKYFYDGKYTFPKLGDAEIYIEEKGVEIPAEFINDPIILLAESDSTFLIEMM